MNEESVPSIEEINDTSEHDLALSFWTVSFQYLRLVENVAKETASQGNTWIVIKDHPINDAEHDGETRWSDHSIVIPVLFNLYQGIELLVKGFLSLKRVREPTHSVRKLCRQFENEYEDEDHLIAFFRKYTEDDSLPPLLKHFLKDNKMEFERLYETLRYPADQKFENIRRYAALKYKGERGIKFFQELHEDIKAVRIAAVKLSRRLES